jgi:hypothetical protein
MNQDIFILAFIKYWHGGVSGSEHPHLVATLCSNLVALSTKIVMCVTGWSKINPTLELLPLRSDVLPPCFYSSSKSYVLVIILSKGFFQYFSLIWIGRLPALIYGLCWSIALIFNNILHENVHLSKFCQGIFSCLHSSRNHIVESVDMSFCTVFPHHNCL